LPDDEGEGALEDSLLTPYQMVRQHSELEIQEAIDDPLIACCQAVQDLRKGGVPLTFIIVSDSASLAAWLPDGVELSALFGVVLFTDPDTPEDVLFFCGSQESPMIRDVEKSICCRMV
jgi:hypothetical protein